MPLQSAKKLIETLRSEGTLLLFAKLNLKKGKERFSSPIQCYQWETTNPNFKWRGGGGGGGGGGGWRREEMWIVLFSEVTPF